VASRQAVAALRLDPHTTAHALALARSWPLARFTSGRRTVAENRRAGGVPNSWHLVGRAVDVVVPGDQKRAFIRWVWAHRASPNCTGPEEVIDEGDHIHVAW